MPVHITAGGKFNKTGRVRKHGGRERERESEGRKERQSEKQFNLFMCGWMVLTASTLHAGGEQFGGHSRILQNITI